MVRRAGILALVVALGSALAACSMTPQSSVFSTDHPTVAAHTSGAAVVSGPATHHTVTVTGTPSGTPSVVSPSGSHPAGTVSTAANADAKPTGPTVTPTPSTTAPNPAGAPAATTVTTDGKSADHTKPSTNTHPKTATPTTSSKPTASKPAGTSPTTKPPTGSKPTTGTKPATTTHPVHPAGRGSHVGGSNGTATTTPQSLGWSLADAPTASPMSMLPGAHGRKVLALTFDDGPGPYTGKILDVLASRHVHATFCQIGIQVGDFPQVERRIVSSGNSLCNHSWDHKYSRTTSAATIPGEIDKTSAAILAATGVRPRLMRAPGGLWTPALYSALKARHVVPLGWAVDPDDWKEPGTATIVSRVLAQVRSGAVILMHDGGGNRSQTVAALGTIIDRLKARGYTFVTL